jgi:putative YhbY family RNA-binding protein
MNTEALPATPRAIPALSPAQRKALRAEAHHLDPVVTIGDAGLTDAVLAEADRALAAHGLIKIRVHGDDRAQRLEMLDTICARLGCAPVQTIGKLLVVWRQKPETATGGNAGTARRRPVRQPKKAAGAGQKPAAARRATAARKAAPAKAASPSAQAPAKPGAKARAAKPADLTRSARPGSGTRVRRRVP